MARKILSDSMFDLDGRPRCEDCAAHDLSAEGRATNRLLTLVYQLAGYAPTPRYLDAQRNDEDTPEELNLRAAYYAAYHARAHVSYAELDLEETAGK
jgi:hypothetical protein